MKFIFVFIFMILLGIQCVFSQDMLFSQYYNFQQYINPATTGLNPCGRMYLNYRNSTLGGYDYSNYAVAADIPLKRENAGIGGVFQWQQDGLVNNGILGLQFAKKIRIYREIFLSMGMEAGGVIRTYNKSDVVLPTDLDPDFEGNPSILPKNGYAFDVTAGISLVAGMHVLGFATKHITEPSVKASEGTSLLYRKYTVHYAAKIPYAKYRLRGAYFSPHFLFDIQKGNNQATTGVYMTYKKAGGGVWVRTQFPFRANYLIIMWAIKTLNFQFSYSYDIPLNGSGIVTGAHELGVKYFLPSNKHRNEVIKQKNCLTF